MTEDALARAEANFAAAKELCRTGHADCTYGGMSSAHGYWLAAEGCELNHGESCDLRAVCDGAAAVAGFRGSDPDPDIWYWIWAVAACQPCADLYVAAHSEWKRPDAEPAGPRKPLTETLRELAERDRATLSPAQIAASEMMTNMLLYGQHPAPPDRAIGHVDYGRMLDEVVGIAFGRPSPVGDFPELEAQRHSILDTFGIPAATRARWAEIDRENVRRFLPQRAECRRYDSGTWVHATSGHTCPPHARGQR